MSLFENVLLRLLDITDLNDVLTILQKYLFNKTKYYDLGLNLGLLAPTLDAIRANNANSVNNVADYLRGCLSDWLCKADDVESKGGPTYYTLIAALRAIGENAVADGINRESKRERSVITLLLFP